MTGRTATRGEAAKGEAAAVPAGRRQAFAGGLVAGIGVTLLLGAARGPAAVAPLVRPVAVTLHRFEVAPGRSGMLDAWIGFLRAHRREAVATLPRERTYLEAMFTAADEPHRLYWLTVQGAGGAPVESSELDLDRRHRAYMAATLVKGSHARFRTRNVLAPDFVLRAVREEQARDEQEREGR